MRVLVTGTSGRIGAAVARVLALSADVVGFDAQPGAQTTFVGSIVDRKLVDSAIEGASAVVHCAGLHAPHVATHSQHAFRQTNVEGTRILLEAARRASVRRFVYTSSTSVYGSALVADGAAVWVTEKLQPQPRDIYDETKLAAEQACREAMASGLPCVVLRMSRCFAEPKRLMQIYRLYRGVAAGDVAQAHCAALHVGLKHFEVFNISAQSPFQREDCKDLFENAAEVIRLRMPAFASHFERQGWPLPRSIDRVYVVDKAMQQLGYSPRENVGHFFSNRDKKG